MTAADVGPNAPEHRIGGLPRDLRVVVAALPKSGSTFLTELLARLPGMRTAYPVPGYDRREQELCAESLRQEVHNTRFMRQLWRRQALAGAAPPRGFVAQLHLRHSEPTAALLRCCAPSASCRSCWSATSSTRWSASRTISGTGRWRCPWPMSTRP